MYTTTLLSLLLWLLSAVSSYAPSLATSFVQSSANGTSAFSKDDFIALVQRVIQMRQAQQRSWDSTVANLSTDELKFASRYIADHAEAQRSRLILFELIRQSELIDSSVVHAVFDDEQDLKTLLMYYELFSWNIDKAERGSPVVLDDTDFNEAFAIRNFILYGMFDEEEKIRRIGDLIVSKQKFVDVGGLIQYISIIDPSFARSLGTYVYCQEPDYQPWTSYATHFSLVVALAIADGCDIDIHEVADRVDYRDMAVILSEEQYREICAVLDVR